jgi:hypothetical protein
MKGILHALETNSKTTSDLSDLTYTYSRQSPATSSLPLVSNSDEKQMTYDNDAYVEEAKKERESLELTTAENDLNELEMKFLEFV